MFKQVGAIAALSLFSAAGAAHADSISPGGSISGATILGTASIYNVFGLGDPGDGGATSAFLASFSAGAGNVFTVTATGTIGCCSAIDGNFTPDGASGGMNISGWNGLSSLTGDRRVPLVGVFTTETSPFGGPAPAALNFSGASATDLAPLLHQVFYIGDGRAGVNDGAGTLLHFTAPTAATRLYLGVIDSNGFGGVSSFYADNPGSFTANLSLTNNSGAVPEPRAWALMILGFGGVGAVLRYRRRFPAIA